MKKRKNLEIDVPPIGDRSLTLREAADALRQPIFRIRVDANIELACRITPMHINEVRLLGSVGHGRRERASDTAILSEWLAVARARPACNNSASALELAIMEFRDRRGQDLLSAVLAALSPKFRINRRSELG